MRTKLYLIATICFVLATAAGIVALLLNQGHWSQVVIPAALLLLMFVLWRQARAKQV